MQTGIQTADVLNTFERLNPTDASIDFGTIDPSIITPVFNMDAAFISQQFQLAQTFGTSLNGTTVNITDISDLTGQFQDRLPSVERQRYWQSVSVGIAGGTVNPIGVSFRLFVSGTTIETHRINVANPGFITVGPFFGAPGVGVRVQTITNGGAGDELATKWQGFTAPSGVPIPLLPAMTVSVGN